MTIPASQADLKVLKALGRAHINANRLDQALDVFAEILLSYPEDVETHLILGDCYLAANQPSMAAKLYRQAHNLDPDFTGISDRLALIEEEAEIKKDTRLLIDESNIDTLLLNLTGKGREMDAEQLERASALLELITDSEHPALAVSEYLDEIEELLPAFLELNIKQARSNGQSDLASDLEHLLESFYNQREDDENLFMWNEGAVPGLPSAEWDAVTEMTIAVLQEPGGILPPRINITMDALGDLGCRLETISTIDEIDGFQGQAVLVHAPHASAERMALLAQAAARGIPIVIDLQNALNELQESMGLLEPDATGSGVRKFISSALHMADAVTVQSSAAATLLRSQGHHVEQIPYAWNRKNPLWEKPGPDRSTINIGWFGSPEDLDAVASVRRAVLRILREFPQTSLVIGGSPEAYQLFDSIPESRRTFLPDVPPSDYPFSLAQVDIMIDPDVETDTGRDHSDRLLVEAGVRNTPWVASRYAAAEDWSAGGLFAEDIPSWHAALHRFVTDEDARVRHGRDGYLHAKGREIRKLAPRWLNAFRAAIRLAGEEAQ